MQSIDIYVINQAAKWIKQQPVWLCTVIETYGSSPRPPGGMMAITATGQVSGSLSGGCIEEDLLQRIAGGEYRAASTLIRYGDGNISPSVALPCGGILTVLIEHLPSDNESAAYLQKMVEAVNEHSALQKHLVIGQPCTSLTLIKHSCITQVIYTEQQILVQFAAPFRLFIAGLSSVALYCADFAHSLGFDILVCENRPDALANFAAQLKPGVTLLKQFPANFLEQQSCHLNTAIVALTHDARVDDLTIMEAVNTPAFYIGVMGSHLNSARRLERLQRVADLSPAQLERIHAPIGLPLGSKTPAEIALAVMADIVKRKNETGVVPPSLL